MIYQPIENTGEYTTGTVYSEGYVKSLEQENKRLKEENEYLNFCANELRDKITNLKYKIARLEEDRRR